MKDTRVQETLDGVIDSWCARRKLKPLAVLLPAYVAYSGLTDSVRGLYEAICSLRGLSSDQVTDDEKDAISEVRASLARALATVGVFVDH